MTTPDVPALIGGAADALQDAAKIARSLAFPTPNLTSVQFQTQRIATIEHARTAIRMLEVLAPPLDTEPYADLVTERLHETADRLGVWSPDDEPGATS